MLWFLRHSSAAVLSPTWASVHCRDSQRMEMCNVGSRTCQNLAVTVIELAV